MQKKFFFLLISCGRGAPVTIPLPDTHYYVFSAESYFNSGEGVEAGEVSFALPVTVYYVVWEK